MQVKVVHTQCSSVQPYLEQAKPLKQGLLPSGTVSWYLHCSVSASHANTVSSLKHVNTVLLSGRKNTCNKKRMCYKIIDIVKINHYL